MLNQNDVTSLYSGYQAQATAPSPNSVVCLGKKKLVLIGTQQVLNLVARIKKKNISVFFISKKNGLLLTVTKKESPG